VEPENTEEETAKRVKHFNEEIPPETNIRAKIGKGQLHAIGRYEKLPRRTQNEVRQRQERSYCACQASKVSQDMSGGRLHNVHFRQCTVIREQCQGRRKKDRVQR